MTTRPPTVRRRRLGAELRRLREQRGFTGDQIAAGLRWSSSKLSRIETAKIGVRERDVLRLLETYRVDEREARKVLALCRAAAQRGWWEEYTQDITPLFARFIALEDEADVAFEYTALLMPGLLQIDEYAEHVLRSYNSIIPISERRLARRAEVRARRRRVLTRSNPLSLSVIMDEGVLLRNIGGTGVMHRQLDHLVRQTEKPNISLQVLPLRSPGEPIIGESFTLLRFASDYETRFPDIAHIDTLAAVEIQDDDETSTYRMAWESLAAKALSPTESRELISGYAGDRAAGLR